VGERSGLGRAVAREDGEGAAAAATGLIDGDAEGEAGTEGADA
jgi:hypothetical protein